MGEPNVDGVGGLLDRITWDQFRAWQEYATLEPYGEERADLRSAIIASVIANGNIDTRKTKPLPPAKFMARRWFDPTADGETGGGAPTAQGWQQFKEDLIAAAEGRRPQDRGPQPRTANAEP